MKIRWIAKASTFVLALAGLLSATTSLKASHQYRDDEIRQTVARIAYFSGDVSFARGDQPDSWQRASLNFPMTLGDRVYTARDGRLELQANGSSLFLAPGTDLSTLNLRDDVQQYSLTEGIVSVRIRRLREDETFEIDTPNAAVTFERSGTYRIDVDRNGNTRVGVLQGRASVAAGGGEVPLSSGDLMTIDGLNRPRYDVYSLPRQDGWDRWVELRARRYRTVRAYDYVSADIVGAGDLDGYGRWDDIPSYGRVWSPQVQVGWAPYRQGRWAWQDPWGWTWVSDEPWGWAPYHYGRWVTYSSRWYWVPTGPSVRCSYSPALVGFIGGGRGGFSASISIGGGGGGGGFVGWFPLAPRDPFVPWWGGRQYDSNYGEGNYGRGNVTNVTYVNQSYVTVVNQNVFISGQSVASSTIRDASLIRRVVEAPVVQGPLQIIPTRDSIRVSGRADISAPRPPDEIQNRTVVTRMAPPAAPPTFEAKQSLIRQGNGAPIAPAASTRLALEHREEVRPIAITRPVISGEGVSLTPREGSTSAREVRPVTAQSGRIQASPDRALDPAPQAAPTSPRLERNPRQQNPDNQGWRNPQHEDPPVPATDPRTSPARPAEVSPPDRVVPGPGEAATQQRPAPRRPVDVKPTAPPARDESPGQPMENRPERMMPPQSQGAPPPSREERLRERPPQEAPPARAERPSEQRADPRGEPAREADRPAPSSGRQAPPATEEQKAKEKEKDEKARAEAKRKAKEQGEDAQ